jgi:hypothetical protein
MLNATERSRLAQDFQQNYEKRKQKAESVAWLKENEGFCNGITQTAVRRVEGIVKDGRERRRAWLEKHKAVSKGFTGRILERAVLNLTQVSCGRSTFTHDFLGNLVSENTIKIIKEKKEEDALLASLIMEFTVGLEEKEDSQSILRPLIKKMLNDDDLFISEKMKLEISLSDKNPILFLTNSEEKTVDFLEVKRSLISLRDSGAFLMQFKCCKNRLLSALIEQKVEAGEEVLKRIFQVESVLESLVKSVAVKDYANSNLFLIIESFFGSFMESVNGKDNAEEAYFAIKCDPEKFKMFESLRILSRNILISATHFDINRYKIPLDFFRGEVSERTLGGNVYTAFSLGVEAAGAYRAYKDGGQVNGLFRASVFKICHIAETFFLARLTEHLFKKVCDIENLRKKSMFSTDRLAAEVASRFFTGILLALVGEIKDRLSYGLTKMLLGEEADNNLSPQQNYRGAEGHKFFNLSPAVAG